MAKTTAKPPASMSSVLFGGQPGPYPTPAAAPAPPPKAMKKAAKKPPAGKAPAPKTKG